MRRVLDVRESEDLEGADRLVADHDGVVVVGDDAPAGTPFARVARGVAR
jgi:hypothetical protein